MKKIGFVGAGNMAGALVKGLARNATLSGARPLGERHRRGAAASHEARATVSSARPDNRALVAGSAVVVLAVKPQIMDAVLAELRPVVTRRQLFVSIAAGITTARLEAGLGARTRVVRAMPNTPALVGAGMTVLVRGSHATAADERLAATLFGGVGDVAPC